MRDYRFLEVDDWEYVPIYGLYVRNVYSRYGIDKFKLIAKEYSPVKPMPNYIDFRRFSYVAD